MPVTRQLTIVNARGLHARASARFVETVERFDASVTVSRDGQRVSGDSIMGLLMLAAPRDSVIEIAADGPDAAAVAEALASLVAAGFGENDQS